MRCLAVSRDHIFSGSFDATIKCWDAQTGECLRTLEGHQGPVSSIVAFPSGDRVISASFDKTLRLWDVEKGSSTMMTASFWGSIIKRTAET